ncbi:hypothetical protein F4861DRAFT_515316 [Xylaria intraflava]|nr:hypothetical protein F4861DRAFT_515316 [Xylaria intraflava]
MGIRGLGPAVSRYGIFTPIGGDTVVVDGPSLIYQIFEGCMARRPATAGFICYPSYSILGRMVVGWLEELRRHNVTIRKIYFDGYLPPTKWQVRRERLLSQSQKMTDLLTSHPHGSSRLPVDTFETLKPTISLIQTHGQYPSRWLPKPPFLVPAVLEILRSCRTWGPLVEVVAGEADMFCAENVRQHGGTVLTADSDLFITDLGSDGNVSFFTDVIAADLSDESQGLVARKFSLHATNDRLGLNEVGGLARVAFDMSISGQKWQHALERTKRNQLDHTPDSSEFIAFMEELSMKKYLPADHPIQNILSSLDPRISEIIIQTLLFDGDGASADRDQAKNSRGPETLAMFLPIMIEKRDRKSTWTMSTTIRQLAYGIMQSFAPQKSATVIEYRVLSASSSLLGRKIDLLGSDEALEQSDLLVDALKQLAERLPSVDMLWLAFAIYQDITWSKSQQRQPLSVSLIGGVNDSRNYLSWDTIHFAAQVQASLYSLRMLKQALDVAAFLRQSQPSPMLELHERLSSLPPITEWPTEDNISQMLSAAGEANVLSVIADILGDPAIKDLESSQKRTRKKRKNKNGNPGGKRHTEQKVSRNPFAVLSED